MGVPLLGASIWGSGYCGDYRLDSLVVPIFTIVPQTGVLCLLCSLCCHILCSCCVPPRAKHCISAMTMFGQKVMKDGDYKSIVVSALPATVEETRLLRDSLKPSVPFQIDRRLDYLLL